MVGFCAEHHSERPILLSLSTAASVSIYATAHMKARPAALSGQAGILGEGNVHTSLDRALAAGIQASPFWLSSSTERILVWPPLKGYVCS